MLIFGSDLPDSSPQSSRLAVFGGLGMSFNICRGTLGSLAIFTVSASGRRGGGCDPEYLAVPTLSDGSESQTPFA